MQTKRRGGGAGRTRDAGMFCGGRGRFKAKDLGQAAWDPPPPPRVACRVAPCCLRLLCLCGGHAWRSSSRLCLIRRERKCCKMHYIGDLNRHRLFAGMAGLQLKDVWGCRWTSSAEEGCFGGARGLRGAMCPHQDTTAWSGPLPGGASWPRLLSEGSLSSFISPPLQLQSTSSPLLPDSSCPSCCVYFSP